MMVMGQFCLCSCCIFNFFQGIEKPTNRGNSHASPISPGLTAELTMIIIQPLYELTAIVFCPVLFAVM